MEELREAVNDEGPLITLEKLPDGFSFIRTLYRRIIVPPAIIEEVERGDQIGEGVPYAEHYGVDDLLDVRVPTRPIRLPGAERLQEGETQAICLALELDLPLLIEETVGRRTCGKLGVPVSSIAGEIIWAHQYEAISAAEAKRRLDRLYEAGRINRRLHRRLTEAVDKRT